MTRFEKYRKSKKGKETKRKYRLAHIDDIRRWSSNFRKNHSDHLRAYYREYRKANKEKIAESQKRYECSNKGRAIKKAYRMNPEEKKKINTRTLTNYHIRVGNITKRSCFKCGESKKIHAHHRNYNDPFDIVWVCPIHHSMIHKQELVEV